MGLAAFLTNGFTPGFPGFTPSGNAGPSPQAPTLPQQPGTGISTFGPRDMVAGMSIPYNPNLTPAQNIFLQARQAQYQAFQQAMIARTPMSEQQSTDIARAGHEAARNDRQELAQGVEGGQINRSEFRALSRFSRDTEFLRARLREGGYTPAEAAYLERRSQQYRQMQQAFLSADWQMPQRGGQSSNPVDQKLDQLFDRARNGNTRQGELEGELGWYASNAYGAGMEGRSGPVQADERVRARVRGQELRDQAGVKDGPTAPRGPRPEGDRNRARNVLAGLSSHFQQLDTNGNGRLSHAEMRAVIANPQQFGYTAAEAAALFEQQERIAGIDRNDSNPLGNGRDASEISRSDLRQSSCLDSQEFTERREAAVSRLASNVASSARPAPSQGLFGREGRPDPNSIQQNREGSCWLLAAMSQMRPEEIQNMVRQTRDGKVVVQFPGRPPEVVSSLTEAERRIYSNSNGDWAAYIEKAAAQHYARQDQDINGGRGNRAYDLLRGTGGETVSMREPRNGVDGRDPAQVGRVLEQALSQGRMVITGVSGNDFNPGVSNVSSDGHAYAVVGYDPRTQTVTLRNPWGNGERADRDGRNDGTFSMSLREFQVTFSDLDVQSPRFQPAGFR